MTADILPFIRPARVPLIPLDIQLCRLGAAYRRWWWSCWGVFP
jgi:hypothetical protein